MQSFYSQRGFWCFVVFNKDSKKLYIATLSPFWVAAEFSVWEEASSSCCVLAAPNIPHAWMPEWNEGFFYCCLRTRQMYGHVHSAPLLWKQTFFDHVFLYWIATLDTKSCCKNAHLLIHAHSLPATRSILYSAAVFHSGDCCQQNQPSPRLPHLMGIDINTLQLTIELLRKPNNYY